MRQDFGRVGFAETGSRASHGAESSFVSTLSGFDPARGEPFKVLSLFAGIGGFDLGLERTGGFRTVAFCEIDPFCQRVLAKHWPEVPCYDDVRTLTAEQVGPVDVICGGFPCQDVSTAGRRAGLSEGTRSGLWTEFARLIGELRPGFVIVENTAGLLSLGMGIVIGDLARLGYDAEWQPVSAEDIGAPHPRERVWIVAYPCGSRLERLWRTERIEEEIALSRRANDDSNAAFIAGIHSVGKRGLCAVIDANPHRPSWAGQQWPETEPLLCRVGDGLPHRVDRTSALGNAVVPQIAELIGRAILASCDSRSKPVRAETALAGSVHESGGGEANRPNTVVNQFHRRGE